MPFTMAFIKLTINQIMYSSDNSLIPIWPSALQLEGNNLIYTGLYTVLLNFHEILKQNNSPIIHIYIIELIYQTACPLVDCKMTNLAHSQGCLFFKHDVLNICLKHSFKRMFKRS